VYRDDNGNENRIARRNYEAANGWLVLYPFDQNVKPLLPLRANYTGRALALIAPPDQIVAPDMN
jgi:hypothetical protein